jgi:Domain of unknown function (DUF6457)
MDDWLDRFADALGEERVTPREMGALLKVSRDVAHGVERKYAPLSTFLVGLYVGMHVAAGEGREDALRRAVSEAKSLIPREPGASGGAGPGRAGA